MGQLENLTAEFEAIGESEVLGRLQTNAYQGPARAQAPKPPVSADDPEKKLKEILARITRNLRLADEQLGHDDAGTSTQQVQRDIARDLSDLIEQAKRELQTLGLVNADQDAISRRLGAYGRTAGSSRGSRAAGVAS